ncbi:MAG TPA: hypothetical protein PLV59_03665 [Candidatus Dojkabacteria bacterium]|nr:hypothetical protein [Candidatus Dojkabacteria bacterium]
MHKTEESVTKQQKPKLSEIAKKKMEEIFIKQKKDPKEDPAKIYLQLLNQYEPPVDEDDEDDENTDNSLEDYTFFNNDGTKFKELPKNERVKTK